MRQKRIYLDYAAATPVDTRILRAMRPYFSDVFGNPSSLHRAGAEALKGLDHARETFSRLLGVDFRNTIFTASATEANNLALRGIVRGSREWGVGRRVIVSAVEHDSILETARDMERAGEAEVVVIPVDREGVINLRKLKAALDERTVLVSVMYVNNEVGTVQPISEIAKIILAYKSNKSDRSDKSYPLFHTDAAQAFLYYPCRAEVLGADCITLSSQKIYGPKGAGALVLGSREWGVGGRSLHPILTGGGQEFGFRAGTENVPAIVGFAAALEHAERERAKNTAHAVSVRDTFERELMKNVPGVERNGPSRDREAPHITNLAFRGVSSEDLLVLLDREGVAVSPGAACSARALTLSHVLRAIKTPDERITRSIRFSFGRGISVPMAREAAKRVAHAASVLTKRYFSRDPSL
ncbi:MAG: cysteine desulfurase family protein [Candidatus Jorgensenbacteria bacterium]|nr:cysteine desulfurase family protein [Candidatus Jorgensenbacteria bacterium]